eukprot:TRINITY_DN20458_c0_g1_i1.p1 TRINITY_DN20458_c0_g1~~TRINITY_DN20458_c0_g1_i1.p1  ORF type:complete len:143 (+),score=31.81 TRINITY_DN20458_c0_g1_i1:63-491(+)
MPTLDESVLHHEQADGNTDVVFVMEEYFEDDYKPSKDEMEEYIRWLGGSLPEDEEFLWIAFKALTEPLPKHWRPCQMGNSTDVFYYNFATGESVWEHPCDERFRALFDENKREKKSKKNKKMEREQATRKVEPRRSICEDPN